MITGKQRSYLRGLAQQLDAGVYIGKQGLTENVLREIDTALEHRELVKVKLQEACDLAPGDTANQVAAQLSAEFVQAIGRKFVLYRPSRKAAEAGRQIVLPR